MPRYFEFDVTLVDTKPRIWRRLQLRPEATFGDLHRAIQDACGWENYHLFRFESPERAVIAGIPDEEWDPPDPDAERVRLSSHFPKSPACLYLYDFGDGWEHLVELRDTRELPESFHRRLIDGARAFPPEDSGGLPGYDKLVAVARGDPDPEGLREWMDDWHPEHFDLETMHRRFDT